MLKRNKSSVQVVFSSKRKSYKVSCSRNGREKEVKMSHSKSPNVKLAESDEESHSTIEEIEDAAFTPQIVEETEVDKMLKLNKSSKQVVFSPKRKSYKTSSRRSGREKE